MMYQMLSGRLPFTSDKESYVEIVLGHLNQPVPPLVGGAGPIPGFLIQVVMRTLEKDPTLRPTARELLTDLVRVARYTIDSGTTSGELALPRSEQFAGDGGLGLDAEKTGEVPALNVETSNASAKTLPPATTAAVLSRTIEEEPPTANRVAHERTQEFVRPGKSVS